MHEPSVDEDGHIAPVTSVPVGFGVDLRKEHGWGDSGLVVDDP